MSNPPAPVRRHTAFHSSRPVQEPIRHASIAVAGSDKPIDLSLRRSKTTGPLAFLNPTSATYEPPQVRRSSAVRSASAEVLSTQSSEIDERDPEKAAHLPFPGLNDAEREAFAKQIQFKWRARDNRKGRHSLVVFPPTAEEEPEYVTPELSSSFKSVLRNIKRMFTVCLYWDVSYLVAVSFTLGSLDWCLNAFFVWLPFVAPDTDFHNEILTAGGVTAFIGATIFEIGSILLFLEAVNENHSSCFGWELSQQLEKGGLIRVSPDKNACRHHHQRNSVVRKGSSAVLVSDLESASQTESSEEHEWRWLPSWEALKSHYFHELGFLASFTQFCAASVFWISGIVALPGVINHITSQAVLNGVYWVPQIVGGSGFILSGYIQLLLESHI